MSKLFIVVFSLGLISACVGQIVQIERQCDPNLPTVASFVPENFAGSWYDIESLEPTPPVTTGTCPIHSWTVSPTGFSLQNSQVVDRSLQFVTGTAVPTTGITPGTAKYTVTIISSTGVSTAWAYTILSTDYNTFALVYACRNVGTSREVNLWKLGRNTGSLPPAAEQTIQGIIDGSESLNTVSANLVTRSHSSDSCYATIEVPGSCPPVTGVPEFNVNNFLGTWQEYSRYPNNVQTGQCSRAEYTAGATAGVVNVVNTEVFNNNLLTTTGTATTSTTESGLLQVQLSVPSGPVNSDLYVLATDYNNYALVYSCTPLSGDRRRISSWQLRKTDTPLNEGQITAINTAINSIDGLNSVYFQETSRTSEACIHYPELPPLSNTVELRGPCAEIAGSPDFTLSTFLGTWHEVARYPNSAQTGQCNRAEYTAGATADVVSIANSEVNGGALSTILGTARPTAQPGVLQVDLDDNGVTRTQTLHVLTTDHTSYALVYSCVNVPGNNRRVSSWKLSKTGEPLTGAANTAIDAVITTTNGLHNQYYQETSRTSEACIHYPVLPPLSNTVELRGPCADIGGFSGFNLNAFLGTWHEVARYPNSAQTGQCNRAEYTAGATADVVSIANSEVNGGALSTILGTARPTAQPGVLQVDLDDNGVTRTQTLHVLTTDHTSYALVYSCVNVPGNNRRVSSWKLSKTGEPLTGAANTAIDAVITTTNGLHNQYYQETSLTSAACIHYPVLPPLSNTVELRGPCADIGGFSGFNLNAFLGTWHEVARYPNSAQTGQCNRAEYTAGATADVVSIANSEVNGGALSTILGTARPTAQSGVLQVELDDNGVTRTQTLHVLTTDHTSYALVYSCVNVPGNNRRVSSWKLSKTGEPLTGAANTAIDAVITATNGLHNQYYQETSRTSEACIHYPVLPPLSNTVELRGPCANIAGFSGFDLNAFLGTWLEVARYPNEAQTGQCNRAEYTAGATADVVSIANSEVNNEALSTILGTARPTAQSGVLQVELTVAAAIRSGNLHVLATDHNSYALVYSCVNVPGNNRRVSSWKLSKSTDPLSPAANAAIDAAITATNGLDSQYYQETSQSDAACFYYPVYETLPNTIELRGSCPTTITGVAAFDLNAFLGTWHEVARYPNEAQTGQCNRAEYTAGATADVVSIANSEVNGGALSTILGTARPTAQSGVLQVELDVNGVSRTRNLHVLATDYNNYALVYSCDNIEGNRRRVSSWKLSKTGEPLTGAANTAIDAVITATQGLDNRYYQETSRTSEACIHYPVLPPLSNTVELRGPCANIAGFSGFNLNAFLGTWHEVARYPNSAQTGQCNRAEYTAGATADVVSIANTEINGGALSTILGTARPTAQSGVLQVELNDNGVTRTQTLHVLTTDHTSYALVYSCVNVPGNNRRVSSWKLSKTGEPLTGAANTAIDAVITATQGLDNRYYQETSRTSEACIHYPVLPPLSNTVELRGPCANIAGFSGFNLNAFLGTWHEVARYPNEAQTGQCNRAEYTAGATADVVSIANSEVNNEALSTILGTARPTAQSGVLQVELTVAAAIRSGNLHVLATDHNSYALVYSCVNVPGNNRRVSSWKLSKSTDPLSPAANAAIDAAITATNGLDSQYYQETSQSDAACFYYPVYETLPNTIELRGSCPTTITGVAAFDLNAFLGTWHEVARYPNEAQTGQCNRAEYTAGATADVVSIANSEVNGGALSTILGTARPTAQSGVLQVELDVNGVSRTRNLHVLATDYNNYALVYSCDNIEGNRRRVSSWKLSKTGEPLTGAANTAIDAVITATNGLHNQYYQETSRTSEACIHYPVLPPLSNTVELRGPCADIAGVPDFVLSVFLGTWHEVARYPNEAQTGQCNRADYTAGATADEVSIRNSEVNNEALSTILGTARPTAQSGVLQVELTVSGVIRTTNLHVLATDLTSYALVYSCVNVPGNNRRVSSWKLSKNTDPLSPAANAAIDAAITATNGLDNRYYQETSQSDAACFYYPVYDTLPESIEFRGSCPTTITGVSNFNLNSFLGTWYEVARYPQPAQTGQCNRAVYAPGASTGFISVVNTQVNNEALNTISAQARLVNENGHLQLLFDGVNTLLDIHVLETDYENYALVYSCVDIPGNRRRVSSWKLSKSTNPLSPAANTAIDAVITTTQGLDNRYYQETSQSNADCFYYPEFVTPPSTIELPGPCPTVNPVANFELSRFVGTWYEVARYPQPAQTGQCNRAVYEVAEDGASVVSSQVTDETLQTTSGVVRPTNQPGVLEVVLNVGDESKTTNLHVLATDYDNYALVYSCVNLEENRRRVGSWKLSKSTSPLIDEANVAIDAVISATQGLNEDYYQATSQSETACFHYPTQTGENVIIPGQCDPTISGVTNINLTRFTNELVWYQIKRYDAVVGTCIGTRLTLDEDYIHINYIERVGDEVKKLTGVARLSSAPDGKFTFEMEDSEDQNEIYILATDYDGYAIAYNCKNVGTNERQIGAWLLSRERTSSDGAETALEQLVATKQEFTNRPTYFKDILHPSSDGDECPEPSSGFLFKSSIIVISVCALLQFVW